MKRKFVMLLLLGFVFLMPVCASAERLGIFNRFVWVEEITISPSQIISINPIDTSKYGTMVVQFTEQAGQPFNLMVVVESRIFSDENFRVTGKMDGTKTRFVLSNTSIEEPAKLVCDIYGTETKLDIVNTGADPVTVKISGAFIVRNLTATLAEAGE